jgi:O-antigen ligase
VESFVRTLDNLLFWGLCALLGFGPLAFGAVDAWAICVLEVGVALLLVVWSVREMVSRRSQIVFSPLLLPALLFGAVVAYQLVWGNSAYWNSTFSRAMVWASYAVILFLTPQAIRRRENINSFAVFLIIGGFSIAFFAVIQQLSWNGRIYWVVPNPQGGWVYGPYVNHAHYAGLMEMLTPLPIILALSNFFSSPIRALSLFIAVIMGSTIFLSQSLGGVVSFAVELLVILGISLIPDRRAGRNMLLLGLLCILVVISLLALHPTGLVDRLAKFRDPLSHSFSGDRLAILFDSFKMVRQRPLTGWGLGAFPIAYPSFRSFYSDFWINEAHNDYAQALVETGILGFGAVLFFLLTLYRKGLRYVSEWRQDPAASIKLAALVGCTGLLVHGFFDFNLQIPANAALFFALAALATAPHEPMERQKVRRRVTASGAIRTTTRAFVTTRRSSL